MAESEAVLEAERAAVEKLALERERERAQEEEEARQAPSLEERARALFKDLPPAGRRSG